MRPLVDVSDLNASFELLLLDDEDGDVDDCDDVLDGELLEDGLLLDELFRELPYLLESLEYAELFVSFDDDADEPLSSPDDPCPDWP